MIRTRRQQHSVSDYDTPTTSQSVPATWGLTESVIHLSIDLQSHHSPASTGDLDA